MPVEPHEVQAFLQRNGWSQARLAWEIGVNQPRISRFIQGLKRPNAELEQALDGLVRGQPGGPVGRGAGRARRRGARSSRGPAGQPD